MQAAHIKYKDSRSDLYSYIECADLSYCITPFFYSKFRYVLPLCIYMCTQMCVCVGGGGGGIQSWLMYIIGFQWDELHG